MAGRNDLHWMQLAGCESVRVAYYHVPQLRVCRMWLTVCLSLKRGESYSMHDSWQSMWGCILQHSSAQYMHCEARLHSSPSNTDLGMVDLLCCITSQLPDLTVGPHK